VTGNPLLTGDGFGPEGSLALTALGLPLAAFLWWRMPQTPQTPRALLQTLVDTPLSAASAQEDGAPVPLL